MRNLISGGLIAAALGTAMTVTGAMSAPAQIMHPQPTLADEGQSALLTLVKDGHFGGGGGSRGGSGVSFHGGGGSMAMGGVPMISHAGPGFSHSGPGPGPHSPMTHSNVMPQHMARHDHDHDHDHDHHHHRHNVFFGFGSFAYADDSYPNYYYDDYGYDDAVAYCLNRFRTYDLVTHTYIGIDGLRHPCP